MNKESQTEMIMIDPKELMKFFQDSDVSSTELSEKVSKYLETLSAKEMINQLKHLIYRNMQTVNISKQVFNDLTLTERLFFESVEDLFSGVLNALKWIALHNGEDYHEEFGDIMLRQKVGDIIFGKIINEENKNIDTKNSEEDNILDMPFGDE